MAWGEPGTITRRVVDIGGKGLSALGEHVGRVFGYGPVEAASPNEVERRRERWANAIEAGMSTKPTAGTGWAGAIEAATRPFQSFIGARQQNIADQQERMGQTQATKDVDTLLAGDMTDTKQFSTVANNPWLSDTQKAMVGAGFTKALTPNVTWRQITINGEPYQQSSTGEIKAIKPAAGVSITLPSEGERRTGGVLEGLKPDIRTYRAMAKALEDPSSQFAQFYLQKIPLAGEEIGRAHV